LALGTETSDRCPLFNLGDFYMKKTLVALAALAATGAFAQVSITGEFAYGYQTTSDAAQKTAGGMGVDTSQLWFKANEDLGGGYKAGVSMSLAGADRSGESGNGNVTGRDAQLDLTTPVGLLTVGTKKNADYLSTYAGLGAIWYSLDGNVQGARSKRDQWTFAVPVGAWTFAVSQQEGANDMGLGAGSGGDAVSAAALAGTPSLTLSQQRLVALVANYKSGAIVGDAQYLMFDARTDGSNLSAKDQTRLSGNYDLGVAKIGAGMTQTAYMGTKKVTDILVGVSAPMGATTLAAQWAQNRADDTGAAATDGTRSGYVLQATYNLSKTTYVIGSYKRWTKTLGDANDNTQSNLLLVKDF